MKPEAVKTETEIPSVALFLDPGEKGIVGDMTVVNDGEAPVKLTVRGEGVVIREKHVIKDEEATTPALKVYYMVMNMYLDPATFEAACKPFLELSRQLVTSVPSTGMIMADIGEYMMAGDFRAAFESCFALLEYEEVLEKAAARPADNTA